MLVGVTFLPPSFPPSRTYDILHHKKAKLRKHMRQSVCKTYINGIIRYI